MKHDHDMTYIWEIFRNSREMTREQMSVPYHMYFDETNNFKCITENGNANITRTLNIPNIREHFVLGGIATKDFEEPISFEALKEILRLSTKSDEIEVKAKDIIKRDFLSALKSKKLSAILKYIQERHWFIHFSATNLLYYCLADIAGGIVVNSIYRSILQEDMSILYGINDEFYRIFVCDLEQNIQRLMQFNYPDVKKEDFCDFRTFLSELIMRYLKKGRKANKYTDLITMALIDSEENKRDLVFIEGEKKGILIDDFHHFYTTRICTLAYSNLTFDKEDDIAAHLHQTSISINGQQLHNYTFVKSDLNTYIQLSDIIVSLIAKYFNFLDREWTSVRKDLDGLKYLDKDNLYLLNDILVYSENESKLFTDPINRVGVNDNYRRVIYTYNNRNENQIKQTN